MQNILFSPLPKTTVSPDSKVRLNYLHGIRGLAALYVVFFHVYQDYKELLGESGAIPLWIESGLKLFSEGRAAVAVFIVLSGYCLMLPIIRSSDKKLRGGFWGYLKRRAQRILPPYYAALVLSLMLTAAIPTTLMPTTGWQWTDGQPSFTPGVLLSHIFLVHNLHTDWMFKIDPPMWSVALEWQIYFLFPTFLLPVWRRFGVTPMLTTAAGLSLILHDLVPFSILITLFGLGMFGAIIGFSKDLSLAQWRKNVPWSKLSILFFLGFLAASVVNQDATVVKDALMGLSSICLIIFCTNALTEDNDIPRPLIINLLESKAMLTLGIFSYSLYLVHSLVLALCQLVVNNLAISLAIKGIILFTVVPLASLYFAHIFHILFERRFMSEYSYKK